MPEEVTINPIDSNFWTKRWPSRFWCIVLATALIVSVCGCFVVIRFQTNPSIICRKSDTPKRNGNPLRFSKQQIERLPDNYQCSKAACFIQGRYRLEQVDDRYYEFLSSLGVPWFALSILKRMSETMALLPPQNLTHGTWRWTIDRGVQPVKLNFRMGESFQLALGSFLTLTRNCTLPARNVIVCQDFDESGEPVATSTNRFGRKGINATMIVESQNIIAKKYYSRLTNA